MQLNVKVFPYLPPIIMGPKSAQHYLHIGVIIYKAKQRVPLGCTWSGIFLGMVLIPNQDVCHHWQKPRDEHDVPQIMDTRVSACFMGTPTIRGMSVFLFYLYFANLIHQLAHKQGLCFIFIFVTVKSSTGLTIKWCCCQLCATTEILRFWEVNLAEVLQLVRGEGEGSK